MFVQKLNPLTGEADWVLVNEPGLGEEDDASADLVATSSYLDMLTDTRRNVAYHAALRRVLPAKMSAAAAAAAAAAGADGAGGVRVLDVGTGTGLLAMMAARVMQQQQQQQQGAAAGQQGGDEPAGAAAASGEGAATPAPLVVACEVFPPMQNLSRKVIAANGLADAIRVVDKRSDELALPQPPAADTAAAGGASSGAPKAATGPGGAARARVAARAAAAAKPDMEGRADVIVTEIFDSELLGEGMIPTMRHAVQHLLKDGGVVIPATARVYAQLVQCPTMHLMAGLRRGGATSTATASAARATAAAPGAAAAAAQAGAQAGAAAAGGGVAARVLDVLGELDARARASAFAGSDAYEVREMHVDALWERQQQPQPDGVNSEPPIRPLSEPVVVFSFDWAKPPPPSRRETLQAPITSDGTAHAILLWWQLGMLPEPPAAPAVTGGGGVAGAGGEAPLLLSTAPGWVGGAPEAGGDGGPWEGTPQQWRDHWKQCWVQLADEGVAVRAGDVLDVRFEHDDVNLRARLARRKPAAAAAAAAAGAGAAGAGVAGSDSGSGSSGDAGVASASAAADGAVSASAKERLAALQEESAAQQLMPLLSWLGPQALLQLGDARRLAGFEAALEAALAGTAGAAGGGSGGEQPGSNGAGAEVVVVDGSLALALLAACHPAVAAVTLLQEGNVAAGNWLKAAAARLGVGAKVKPVRPDAFFKRLSAAKAAVPTSSATPAAGPADAPGAKQQPGPLVLLAEPYYSEFEQLVPWAHLKFWRDFDVIRGALGGPAGKRAAGGGGGGGGARRVAFLPRRARLRAVAAALPELWRTRRALGMIEGLDLSPANAVLGVVGADRPAAGSNSDGGDGGDDASDSEGGGRQPLPILPYSVWQAGGGYAELSGRAQLLDLDCGGHLDDVQGEAVLTATAAGECHAIVLWMDYDLTPGKGAGPDGGVGVVSTAPSAQGRPGAAVQGVYLLQQPLGLRPGSRLHVEAEFDGLDADVGVTVTPLPPA